MNLTRLDFTQHPRPPQRELRQRGVFDSGGRLIGHVENIYVDDDGTSRFVDVAMGGFMGLGKKHHLVPIEAVAEADPSSSITLRVDRRTVRSAPTLADLCAAAPDEIMHVRVTTMRVLEGQFDRMLHFIEEVVRPAAEGQEEFTGGIVTSDRSANKIVTASWWSGEESLQASAGCEYLPEYALAPVQLLPLAEPPEIEHYQLSAVP